MAKKVADMCTEKGSRAPAKHKTFQQYTRQHQARVKKRWKEQCHATLSFLGLYNYVATKAEVFYEDTNKLESLSLLEGENFFLLMIQKRK